MTGKFYFILINSISFIVNKTSIVSSNESKNTTYYNEIHLTFNGVKS